MPDNEPCVDIIIPNWNGKDLLVACLASIAGQIYRNYTVTVVDNGSTDGSVELLQEKFPRVHVIRFSSNHGFCMAVNAGIDSGSASLVFLLNNDTELAPDCLEKLVLASLEHDDGFFAPKMLSFHERDLLDGAGDGFLRGGVGYRLGTMEKDGPAYNRSRQVFGACGGAAFYRRSLIDSVGPFDEDFFAYLEDVDLNFRANRAGFSCRYVPEARVYHVGSATTGSKINAFTVRLSTRNNLFLLVKNYPALLFLRFAPAICIYQFFWFLFILRKGQLPAYFSGIAGFFKGLPSMLGKRSHLQAVRGGISSKELVRRILQAERDVVHSIMRRREAQGKGNLLLQVYMKIFL
jgi:GT2 family glycosyltransferase